MSELTIVALPYLHPDAQLLIEATMADLGRRYEGEGDATPVDPGEFEAPRGAFLVGYLDWTPVASAGWRSRGADAELKRMYTAEAARGRGLARRMLAAVEDSARAAGKVRLILETGLKQPEAIALYESAGYLPVPGFGHYKDHELARSFARTL
ncbi:N-acetyltransferase [Pilimelia terevasa]|uniref:N-acetyltransferase n=1 Tax=Pilimelia terevasa TaxID=53372 RepID=A0A8J3BQC0_9ACTN|nr:GNAT family N-acetyltransferase [Pilimelia terevasa]GGK28362.1 N-acetyltransferase [Pilimelia terevasa]